MRLTQLATIISLLLSFQLAGLALGQIAKSNTESEQTAPGLFRLKAVIDESGHKALQDTPMHYWSEKGVELYSNGDLPGAEKSFRSALQDAEHRHADPKLFATLLANLGAVLRDEKQYSESEKLFGRAMDTIKTIQGKRQAILDYTTAQFCALLRKTGKYQDAQALKDLTKDGFVPCNVKDVNLAAAAGNTNLLVSKKRDDSGSGPLMVPWTITVEPGDGLIDKIRGPGLFETFTPTEGPLEIYIDSDFRPIHITCKVPPDTRIIGHGVIIRETYNFPPPRQPEVMWSAFDAPCKMEPMTISGTVPFLGRQVHSHVRMELPEEKVHGKYGDFVRYE